MALKAIFLFMGESAKNSRVCFFLVTLVVIVE